MPKKGPRLDLNPDLDLDPDLGGYPSIEVREDLSTKGRA